MAYTLKKLKNEEIKKMSFSDIFLSSEYRNDLVSLMRTACSRVKYRKACSLNIINDTNNKDIAYTDGNIITINLGAKFAERIKKDPALFHIFVVGLLAHELGHIFWTEFGDGMLYLKSIQSGKIYPAVPNHPNAQKFEDALKDSVNRKVFCDICHSLDNIMEDVYVNALQEEMLGGLYSKGIQIGNILIVEEMSTIDQQKAKGYYDFNIVMNLLLTTLKSGTAIYGKYYNKYQPIVSRVSDIASKYIFKNSHKDRVNGINLIICDLWDYVQEMLDDIKKKASMPQNNPSSSPKASTENGQEQKSGQGQNRESEEAGEGSADSIRVASQSKNSRSDSPKDDSSNCDSLSQSEAQKGEKGKESKSSGKCTSGEESNDSDKTSEEGDDSSKKSDVFDEQKLSKALEEAVEQLEGKTHESMNQPSDDNKKATPAQERSTINPAQVNSDNQDDLKERIESAARFPNTPGEVIASSGSGITTYEKYVPELEEANRSLKGVLDSLAEKAAYSANQEIVKAELVKEVQDIDYGPIHKGINKTIKVVEGNTLSAKRDYDILSNHIKTIVSKLVNTIKRTIKEENLAGERRGRYYGKKLDASHMYRPDLRVFKDNKQPKKEIDTAFYLLIDLSGSMAGSKINAAKLASVMFAEACEKLNIPLEITGHSTGWSMYKGSIELYNFVNYSSFNRNDKYSIANMSSFGCNRDGAAMLYGLERLSKRNEKKKIFIMITDGQPNDNGYHGEAAKSDMKHIKETYAKKGVTFVAAAIDQDKEYIKAIFGKNFLNISNLNTMPKKFGQILSNTVLD